jgi:hypothetical protein
MVRPQHTLLSAVQLPTKCVESDQNRRSINRRIATTVDVAGAEAPALRQMRTLAEAEAPALRQMRTLAEAEAPALREYPLDLFLRL